jgi:hypothetical protein
VQDAPRAASRPGRARHNAPRGVNCRNPAWFISGCCTKTGQDNHDSKCHLLITGGRLLISADSLLISKSEMLFTSARSLINGWELLIISRHLLINEPRSLFTGRDLLISGCGILFAPRRLLIRAREMLISG